MPNSLWKNVLRKFNKEKKARKRSRKRLPRILVMEDHSGTISNEDIRLINKIADIEVMKRISEIQSPRIKIGNILKGGSMSRSTTVSRPVLKAIQRIITQGIDVEGKHFLEAERPADHIYHSYYEVYRWLNKAAGVEIPCETDKFLRAESLRLRSLENRPGSVAEALEDNFTRSFR